MHADRAVRITAILQAALTPATLRVQDDSALHAGHGGAAPGGQTHYTVAVVSAAFRGRSRVARARHVHELLGPEFAAGLHALSLQLHTPEEVGMDAIATSV